MIAIDGRYYFIDFQKIDKVLNSGVGASDEREIEESNTIVVKNEEGVVISETTSTNKVLRPREVNAFRYQVISAMLDEILHGSDDEVEDNGIPRAELDGLPIGKKLSFNTLLEYGIISFIDVKE